MPLKMKLLRDSISVRNVEITLLGSLDGESFSFSLTACIPSLLGIFVYSERTSIVTRMSSSSISFWISFSLFIVFVESFV